MPHFHLNKYFAENPLIFNDFRLIQIGRLYFAPSDSVKLHIHREWYELTIITDGEGFVITNGIATPVKRGSIYLSLPCDMHEIRSSGEKPMKYDFFSFYSENPKYKSELERISNCITPEDRVFFDERISSLVCDAIMEFVDDAKFSDDILYSIFNQIMIYVIRDFENKTARSRITAASQSDAMCYRMMNYIDTHIYTLCNLESIADAMKYNYSYLSALFKKTTGNTLLSYYKTKRLEVAKFLILEGKMKISDIAETLNYSSLYSFSRAFKEEYGISPKQFALAVREISAERAEK